MIEDDERMRQEAKKILAAHGIRLSIDGCGCCGSPWVRMEYQGLPVIYDPDNTWDLNAQNFSLHMFGEEEDDD